MNHNRVFRALLRERETWAEGQVSALKKEVERRCVAAGRLIARAEKAEKKLDAARPILEAVGKATFTGYVGDCQTMLKYESQCSILEAAIAYRNRKVDILNPKGHHDQMVKDRLEGD